VAGYKGDLFEDTDESFMTLYSYSKGLPRDAIKVCSNFLIELAAQGSKKANSKQVEMIAKGQNLHA
jgi:hypothetical protein